MMGRESTPWTEFYWGGTDGGGLLPGGGDFLAKPLDPEGPPQHRQPCIWAQPAESTLNRVCSLSITDPGDTDIIRTMPKNILGIKGDLLSEVKMPNKLPAVPETILKCRKRQSENRANRAKDAIKAKVARKARRVEIFKRAQKYAKEYQEQERDEIR